MSKRNPSFLEIGLLMCAFTPGIQATAIAARSRAEPSSRPSFRLYDSQSPGPQQSSSQHAISQPIDNWRKQMQKDGDSSNSSSLDRHRDKMANLLSPHLIIAMDPEVSHYDENRQPHFKLTPLILNHELFPHPYWHHTRDRSPVFRFGTAANGATGRDNVSLPGASNTLIDADGRIPELRMYSENWEMVKKFFGGRGRKLSSAAYLDAKLEMPFNLERRQVTRVLLSGKSDGVCLAYNMIAFPDHHKYVITGNWARVCGKPWYYSDTFLGYDTHRDIACAWIRDNDLGKNYATGWYWHLPTFMLSSVNDPKLEIEPQDYCNLETSSGPVLRFTSVSNVQGIKGWPKPYNVKWKLSNDKNMGRRSEYVEEETSDINLDANNIYNSTEFDSRLVRSIHPKQTAMELCADTNSHGPDFVNAKEGFFCDMKNKQTHKVCSRSVRSDCFDSEKATFNYRSGKRSLPIRKYTKIIDFGEGRNHIIADK